jgi:hypothetical protein
MFSSHALAQDTSENGLCLTIKNEAKRVCTACTSSTEIEVNPKLASYFDKEKYTCQQLTPITSQSKTEYFFNKINCTNIEFTTCVNPTNDSNQLLNSPILKTSNSEFFNVINPDSGLINSSQSGGAFQQAVQNDGPILGPILLIINFLTGIIATLAILSIVIGSLFMITARGEESQITRGKDIVTNALIAVAIVLTSYTLIKLVQATVIFIIT